MKIYVFYHLQYLTGLVNMRQYLSSGLSLKMPTVSTSRNRRNNDNAAQVKLT